MINYIAIANTPQHNTRNCIVATEANLKDIVNSCRRRQFEPNEITIIRLNHDNHDYDFVKDESIQEFVETKISRVWKKP